MIIIWCVFLWWHSQSIPDIMLAIAIFGFALVAYLLFNLYGSLYLSSNYFTNAHTEPLVTGERTAVLTFDDGPHEQTDDVLKVLEKNNCQATFFVMGERVSANKKALRKMDAGGHSIGNHSYHHWSYFPVQTSAQIKEELNKANDLIKEIIGKTPRFFRPPFGAMSPFIGHALKKMRMEVIGWNVRSFDTENNTQKTLKRVKNKTQDKSNVIILLHDDTENIAELLDSIIIYLKENNYKIIPLSEAINRAPYEES